MKKIVALVLVLLLALSFAACGKADGGKAADGKAAAIKIGGIGPVTGAAAIYGTATKNGAQIAVDEINALGGIQFELNWQDDEHDAEKSVNAYNNLKDWGMQALVGTTTTNPSIAVSTEAMNDRIFMLTPSASSSDVTAGKDNVFQMCFTDPKQGSVSAQYISEHALGKKIAVIYMNDDAYSTGIYNTFKQEADALGLEIVSTTTFTADTSTDFSVQINDAKNAGADLLFLPMYYTPASLIIIQCANIAYEPKFFGVDGMDGILTLEGFDTDLAEEVMFLTPFAATAQDDLTKSFVAAYEKAYGETPNQFAADAYDCVYAIYNAIQINDGITAETPAADVCEKLVKTFTSSDFVFNGLTGKNVTWDTTGAVEKLPNVVIIRNGVYENM